MAIDMPRDERIARGRRTPKMVHVEVLLGWRRVGPLSVNRTPDGEISHIWMPGTGRGPGLYRLTFEFGGGEKLVYIGEGANVAARLSAYTRAYGARSRAKTEVRLARRIRAELGRGTEIVVDAAFSGKLNTIGRVRPIDMRKAAERRFAEAAAVLADADRGVDTVMLNRVLDEDWVLSD